MFKKTFTLCLTLMFLLCMFSFAGAAEQEMTHEFDFSPRWTLIHRISNGLSINDNGLASMVSHISTYSGVESVNITVYLQRQEGNTWVTVNNWTEEYEGTSALWTKGWYVYQGYNYRLMTIFTACDGTMQESAILFSGTQYY